MDCFKKEILSLLRKVEARRKKGPSIAKARKTNVSSKSERQLRKLEFSVRYNDIVGKVGKERGAGKKGEN